MITYSINGYTVEATFDGYRNGREWYNITLVMPDGTRLFGKDDDVISPSPLHMDDEGIALVGFDLVTLRHGDTDSDSFASDTPEETAWRNSSECEYLQCEVMMAQEEE